ncbi:MAG: histidyl-tRNA synthetase [Candidatus Poriferisodalaceae bacterium]|jgi:histidyl-tRNA synthetase
MSIKPSSYRTPIGTKDILPPESDRWLATIDLFHKQARLAGFGLLHTPDFEHVGVFQRVGEGTDVVRKEMWEFSDRSDRRLALRPEGTAPVCRAFVQHRPPTPWKVWYHGPFFRYENPQAGRYRQFHQLGAEVLGSADPDVDVEVIGLAWNMLQAVGLERILLLVNSMGDADTRRTYSEALQTFLEFRIDDIDEDDREKVASHPMRVLDSKRLNTMAVTREAPKLADFLSDEAVAHFDRVQDGLGSLGIPFAIEPRLVRGLDYYTHTTFEFQSSALDSAQNTICGGGRYDGLVEELGGPPTPGIGFGMGLERLLLACDAEGTFEAPTDAVDVWLVDVADGRSARDISTELRRAGITADRSYDGRSMRSQMRAADRSGAALALIIGEQEINDGTIAVRHLRDDETGQIMIPRELVVSEVSRLLDASR